MPRVSPLRYNTAAGYLKAVVGARSGGRGCKSAYSYRGLASRLGLTGHTYLHAIANGKLPLSKPLARRLARVLELSTRDREWLYLLALLSRVDGFGDSKKRILRAMRARHQRTSK